MKTFINLIVMSDLNKINKIYFIGIGGIMMSALARYFLGEGKEVVGSDRVESGITDELRAAGAKIMIGQRPENIDRTLIWWFIRWRLARIMKNT